MKCLVCDNDIRIDTLQQLFVLAPLLLCGRCMPYLIPKSNDVLFENNEWLSLVIEKLNRGDIILTQLFKTQLQIALQKRKKLISNIKIVEYSNTLLYPWLEILVNDALTEIKTQNHATKSTKTLTISVNFKENIPNQIAIII